MPKQVLEKITELLPPLKAASGLKRSEMRNVNENIFPIFMAYNQKTISVIELFRESLQFKLLDNLALQIVPFASSTPAFFFTLNSNFFNKRNILRVFNFTEMVRFKLERSYLLVLLKTWV